MRHKGALLLIACLLLTSCSRLTFVKPKMERTDGEQIAQDYQAVDSPEVKQRMRDQQRLALAAQRLQAGDLEVAEREAKAVLKGNPGAVDALTILGIVEDRRGRSQQAGTYYRQAVERAPGKGNLQNNYGAWLCATGSHAESLIWFDRALQDPSYASPASALANAGDCAAKAGQFERSERDLRRALTMDPRNAVALGAMAENQFRDGRYLEARAFCERRLAAAPANASVLKLAAGIEERLGDHVAAGRYLQKLRAEFPDDKGVSTGGNAGP